MMVPKITTHAVLVVGQNKKESVQVLGTVGSFEKYATFSASQLFRQLHQRACNTFGEAGRGQRIVIVLKVMSHTFRKTITNCCLGIEMFPPLQGKSWN